MKYKLLRTLSIQLCTQIAVKPGDAAEGRVVNVTDSAGEFLVSRGLAEAIQETQQAIPPTPQARAVPPTPAVKADSKGKEKQKS